MDYRVKPGNGGERRRGHGRANNRPGEWYRGEGAAFGRWLILVTGSVLVLFSAFCFGAAVWRHLEPGVPPPRIDVSRIPPWVLVAVNRFLALVALAALVGIWFGRPPGVSS